MRKPRIRAVGVAIVVASILLPGATSLRAAGGNVSGLFLDSEPGDYVGLGDQWAFVGPDFRITPGPASPGHDFVSLGVDGETWGVAIDAPAGQTLTGGVSFPAKNGILPSGWGSLWVGGDGRACTLADGSVTVLEAVWGDGGIIAAFAADFWMDCEDGNTARLHGSIRYQSSHYIRAITVDADRIDFGDTIVGTPSATRVVTIANHGTSAVQFGDPQFQGSGSAAFEVVGNPCGVVLPGSTCTVDVRVDADARGSSVADLVIQDSTPRGQRRVRLSTDAYQTTTTSLVITDMDPDVGFGPIVTVTVSPNPGPGFVWVRWTGGGGEGDPGSTGGLLDPATGTLAGLPLGIGPGVWTVTASFGPENFFGASSDQIVDLDMPLTTWLTVSSNSPSPPGSAALLHVSVNTVFGATLEQGTVTIRDASGAIVATGAVGGATTTFDPEVCCLTAGAHELTATYEPATADALASSATWTHEVAYVVPSGIAFLDNGAPWTSSPIVSVHAEGFVVSGTVTRMQVSNDGVHWDDREPSTDFDWDLTDPAFGGASFDGRHIVSVRWATDLSDWGPSATASIHLDRGPPVSTTPSSKVTTSTNATGGAAPVALAWSGTDDRSGVDHYQVARSTDAGAYATVASTLSTPTLQQILGSGHTYRFRVRPIDTAGNAGAWTYGSTFRLTGVTQSSSAVRYAGTWATSTSTTWWGGTARSSSKAGSTASYTFTGRSIAWVGLKGIGRGKANVYVNGVLKATVDLYSATTRKQVVVWSANYSTSATRTITIKVLGTSGRPRVDIDGFIVRS